MGLVAVAAVLMGIIAGMRLSGTTTLGPWGVASMFALWAFQRGPLTVASVLSAFYPVSTVLLARVVLAERLRRVQLAGVVIAIGAVPLIAVP